MKLKEVKLTRAFMNDRVTMGMIKVGEGYHSPIFSLEEPWKGNENFKSCIPEGRYKCKPFSGNNKDVYKVLNVVDRKNILIHIGNNLDDISGCIAVGLKAGMFNGRHMVFESKKAMNLLRSLICKESFWLKITNG